MTVTINTNDGLTGSSYTLNKNEEYMIYNKNTQVARVEPKNEANYTKSWGLEYSNWIKPDEIKKAISQSDPKYYYECYVSSCDCPTCVDARVKATDYTTKELKNNINKTLVGQMNDFYGYKSVKPNESKPPDFFDYLQKSYEKLSNIEKILLQQNQEPEEDSFEDDNYESCNCDECVKSREKQAKETEQGQSILGYPIRFATLDLPKKSFSNKELDDLIGLLKRYDWFNKVIEEKVKENIELVDYRTNEEYITWLTSKIKSTVGPILSESNENLKAKAQKWTNPQELFKWFITDHRVQEYIEQGIKDYFLAMLAKVEDKVK